MPRLVDRQAHADVALPAGIHLLATEGLAALTFRRIAQASGLTLSAVRNMWPTQELLHQRTAVMLGRRLFDLPPAADWEMTPDSYVQDCIRVLLPWRPEQVEAHRAWLAIRSAPAESILHEVSRHFERTRMTRIAMALAYAERLQTGKPGFAVRVQDYAELTPSDLDGAAGVLLAATAGLADAMARPCEPVTAVAAERWVRHLRSGLLD